MRVFFTSESHFMYCILHIVAYNEVAKEIK